MNEMSTRFIEIGKLMQNCTRRILELNGDRVGLERRIKERKVDLTPPDGWPGSNDRNRDAARDRAFAMDGYLIDWGEALNIVQERLEVQRTELECLKIEQKSLELAVLAYTTWPAGLLKATHNYLEELERLGGQALEREDDHPEPTYDNRVI